MVRFSVFGHRPLQHNNNLSGTNSVLARAVTAKVLSQPVGAVSKDFLDVWAYKPAMHEEIKRNGIIHEVPDWSARQILYQMR